MAAFEYSIEIKGDRAKLFALTQDYDRRLQWDPFLTEATLQNGAKKADKGVRAWCKARYGVGMETEYITFVPPEYTAIKMTKGPTILSKFAGSWHFEKVTSDITKVIFRYNLTAYPQWLGFILNPILRVVFSRDTEKRLKALKYKVETTNILNE